MKSSLSTASVFVLVMSISSYASVQAQTVAASSSENSLSEVVVTGSRVVTNGYNAPTPVTVLGADTLKTIAALNIADAVNELPQLVGSNNPGNPGNLVSSGLAGANILDLRYLGEDRTLVLLDGRRVVSSTTGGVVDINTLPSGLVKRVDVVTGGASAAYGSDAVSGVINFVLDTTFTGLKGDVTGAVAGNGVDPAGHITLSYGTPFASGRGHILLNVAASDNAGARYPQESWYNPDLAIEKNPAYTATNGAYKYIWTPQANNAINTPGGLIVSGPLKGVQFGPGGTPSVFTFGAATGGNETIGGTYNPHDPDPTLWAPVQNQSAFSRFSYDFTQNIEGFAQFTYGHAAVNEPQSGIYTNGGSITIKPDNAFIPASVAAADKGASFSLGTSDGDFGRWGAETDRVLFGALVGLQGSLGSTWKWDASYQYGESTEHLTGSNMYNKAKYALAVDAVVNPANGAIVCRSTLTNPTNGCVPLDVFGTGVMSQAAKAYVLGDAWLHATITQQVAEANIRGEPFSTWAGPVSVGAGIDARWEGISSTVDPTSLISGWYTGNYKPTNGSDNVTEGYIEALAPLAKNAPLMHSLVFDGAARETDYSLSGSVTTWKLGVVCAPFNDDFRIRASRSRDIRAPNLGDLFNGGLVTGGSVYVDPKTGNSYNVQTDSGVGNKDLKPELSDTWEVGFIYSPPFIKGLTGSVDYFDISISNAIASLSGQQIINNCYAGDTQACTLVVRNSAGLITQVTTAELNFANETERGFDIDVTYQRPLSELISHWKGVVSVRALGANVQQHDLTNSGVVTRYAGAPLYDPSWKWFGTFGYALGPASGAVSLRYISGGPLGGSTYTPANLQDDHIPCELYVDLYADYKFTVQSRTFDGYVKVNNVMDKAPPQVEGIPYTTDPSRYDVLGRVFEVGVRFQY